MNRRTILKAAAVASFALMPFAATASSVEYAPGLVKERLAAGETVFAVFRADWCSTCAAQERVIDSLKLSNAAYGDNITFVNVDWDAYGQADLAKELRVPRRSTLVVLRGDQEIGRLVADTRPDAIRALMDNALTR